MLHFVFLMLAAFLVVERLLPSVPFARVPGWASRALFVNALTVGVIVIAGVTWEGWFQSISLFHLPEHLPAPVAAFVAYLTMTFVIYWWHRLRHTSNFLWRTFHQMHHSPARLEALTAFYQHPFDIAAGSIMSSIVIYGLMGLDANAAGFFVLYYAFVGFFIHANITVPRWIGYFIQTPTMHRIHHEYGEHRYNYGDIVWWDMIFGTYRNDRNEVPRCGFDLEKERQVIPMLLAKDVHETN